MQVRASDDDRQRVIDQLQRHTEVGRLTLDEFSDRVGIVYQARTLGELAAATADLPAERVTAETGDELRHDSRNLLMIFLLAVAVLIVFGVLYSSAG